MKNKFTFALIPACILTMALAASAQQTVPDPGAAISGGKTAFEASCAKCHGLDRSLSKIKTAEEWDVTVTRMIRNGAAVTGEQKGRIVAYLAAKITFEAKCSTCHGTDRPLGKAKTAAGWLATVTRMAGKKPGHLSNQEVAAVAAYLALERSAQ